MPHTTPTPAVTGLLRWLPPHQAGRLGIVTVWVLWSGLALPAALVAQEPLHRRLDAALQADQTGPATGLAGDAEYLRRISLDLVGTLPTPAETRAFLADTTSDKRPRAVERLLADPRHALHWAEILDTWLMERRPDKHVPHADWLKYLQTSVAQNKPWNQLAKEIFLSDGTDPATRPAAKFFLDRDAEPNILTRDVGRIFFGVDLQCAQCHDHPLVEHYYQSDYYGLFAFVNRTVLFNDETAKLMVLGEKAEGHADYQSVFTKDAGRSRPRYPGGPELDEPHFPLGEEYVVEPADKVRPVPKFSRRQLLAQATEGNSAPFNRNLPNRVWANLFGRGLVHPVDWQHPHNPPVSPAALDLLTQEFVASGYNLRELIRQIVLTETYQRAIDPPADPQAKLVAATEQLPPLAAQITELEASVKTAVERQAALYTQMLAAREPALPLDQAYQQAIQGALGVKKPWTDAKAALAATQAQITQKQGVIAALTEAAAKGAEVAKVLPNDADITQANTVFANKLMTANTELAALQTTATTQTAAAEDARQKWLAAIPPVEAAYATYATATEPWEALKKQWSDARQATLAVAARLEGVKRHQQRLQASVDWGTTLTQRATAIAAVPVMEAELAAAQQAVVEQQAVVTTATSAVTTTTQELETAQQQLAAANMDLAAHQALMKPIGDALTNVEQALTKLPGDAELAEVQVKLKGKLEPLSTKATELGSVVTARTTALQTTMTNRDAATKQLEAATAELGTRQQTVTTKVAAVDAAKAQVATAEGAVSTARDKVAAVWEQEFVTRIEKPLSPEQLVYALAAATTMLDIQVSVADAEIEKTVPKANVASDPVQSAARDVQVHTLVRERMRGHVNQFITLYGAGPGQPQDQFFATADQALFVANGGTVLSWLNPAGENLTVRLSKLDDPSTFADELYVTVFSRPPSPAETARVTEYLAARAMDRPAAIRELIWALLTSAEFRFNL